jgi:cephalosporin-C deacetylase
MSDDSCNVIYNHNLGFDASYGYSLPQLLEVGTPKAPADFTAFWQGRYQQALRIAPLPKTTFLSTHKSGWQVFDIRYTSTNQRQIRCWLLLPKFGVVKRGFVVGHGYGGRDAPDFHLPFPDAAMLFPCFRGLGLSQEPDISADPFWHVRHHLNDVDKYVLGGCVEDLWLAVSTLLTLFPFLKGHIGYLGISFAGGIGALALGAEQRIAKAHLNVPTFGNQPLRLRLPSQGSANSVQQFYREHKKQTLKVLRYYDAATAAKDIKIPVHCACAMFDPCVAPPGQFAIYNALAGEKQLFVLEAGHYDYPNQMQQQQQLIEELEAFFAPLAKHAEPT